MSGKGKWAHRDTSSDEEEPVVSPPVHVAPVPVAQESQDSRQSAHSGSGGHSGGHSSAGTGAPAHVYDGLSGLLSGIKFSAREEDVDRFLHDAECELTSMEFLLDRETGKFTGRAVIHLVNDVSMRKFLDLDGSTWQGIVLKTKPFNQRRGDSRPFGRDNGREGGGRDGFRPYGRDGGRDHGREGGRGRGGRESSSFGHDRREPREHKEPEVKERPRLQLAPRTLPVEPRVVNVTSSLFGGGRPHDEHEYVAKKSSTPAPAPAAAPVPTPPAATATGAPSTEGAAVPPAAPAQGSYAIIPPEGKKKQSGPREPRPPQDAREGKKKDTLPMRDMVTAINSHLTDAGRGAGAGPGAAGRGDGRGGRGDGRGRGRGDGRGGSEGRGDGRGRGRGGSSDRKAHAPVQAPAPAADACTCIPVPADAAEDPSFTVISSKKGPKKRGPPAVAAAPVTTAAVTSTGTSSAAGVSGFAGLDEESD